MYRIHKNPECLFKGLITCWERILLQQVNFNNSSPDQLHLHKFLLGDLGSIISSTRTERGREKCEEHKKTMPLPWPPSSEDIEFPDLI